MASLDDLLAECFDIDGSAAAAQSAHVALAPVPTAAPTCIAADRHGCWLVNATRWKEPR